MLCQLGYIYLDCGYSWLSGFAPGFAPGGKHACGQKPEAKGWRKEKRRNKNGGEVIFVSVTHDSTLVGLLNGTRDP